MKNFTLLTIYLLMSASFAGNVNGQILEIESPNSSHNDYFGEIIKELGDVNGDGVPEIIVSASGSNVNGESSAGRVFVLDGSTGEEVYSVVSPNIQSNAYFGGRKILLKRIRGQSIDVIEDLNSDGIKDFVIGAPGENDNIGKVYIFSGKDGSFLHSLLPPEEDSGYSQFFFGFSVSGIGDITGDGINDIVVSAPIQELNDYYQNGFVHAYDAVSGDLLYSLHSPDPEDYGMFGFSLTGVDDVNDDGVADFVVGAPKEKSDFAEENNLYADGVIYFFSGKNGELLKAVHSPESNAETNTNGAYFGTSLEVVSDMNGDGASDLMVGDYGISRFNLPDGEIGSAGGMAHLLDGKDGILIRNFWMPDAVSYDNYGTMTVELGDVNGDEVSDFAISAPRRQTNTENNYYDGRVDVVSGKDGSLLKKLTSPNQESSALFGIALSGGGDYNGDGIPDVIATSLEELYPEEEDSYKNEGRVFVFSGEPKSSDNDSPSAPSNLTGQQANNSVELTWDANAESDLAGYNVYRAEASFSATSEAEQLNTDLLTSADYTDSEIVYDQTYYYRVSAVNDEGLESELSEEVEILVEDPNSDAPVSPEGLSATISGEAVDLSWNANTESDLAGYHVYRAEASFSSTSAASRLNNELLSETEYMDDNVLDDIRYYYRVSAVDTDGNESSLSEQVDIILNTGSGMVLDTIAYYPLTKDGLDQTGNHEEMEIVNAPFQDGGIYSNGNYYYGGADSCLIESPVLTELDREDFQISVEFKVNEVPSVWAMPVFVLGSSYREFTFNLKSDQTVSLYLGNQSFVYSSDHSYSLDTWHTARIIYAANNVKLYLDDDLIIDEPYEVSWPDDDRIISNTNFSNGGTYKGLWRNVVAYDSVLQTFEITAVADPAEGGTVSGAGTYDYGETATLTATPETGYEFEAWNEGGTEVSDESSINFTVSEDRDLAAHFSSIVLEANDRNHEITIYPNPVNSQLNIRWSNFDHATITDLSGKQLLKSNTRTIDLRKLNAGVYLITIAGENEEHFTYRLVKE